MYIINIILFFFSINTTYIVYNTCTFSSLTLEISAGKTLCFCWLACCLACRLL